MSRCWKIGLAVSGGADSTALLLLLAALQRTEGFTAVVLHVDHALRPESAADARFVRTLARRLKIPFHGVRVNVVRQPGESLEMAARRERLAFFARAMRQWQLDAVATAHHADDVAETFLMRLARGAGPEGLAGLKRISRLTVHVDGENLPLVFIRPLLDVRAETLRAYLRALGQTWREDATNTDTTILRNKVRHVILPWLTAHFDARMTEHLCKSAAILRGDLTRRTAAPARAEESATRARAEESTPRARAEESTLPANFALHIAPAQGFLRTPSRLGHLPAVAYLDRAALKGRTLMLRPWRAGDRIVPTGLNGHSRKLQDIFVTAKTPRAWRASLPLLVDAATDEILWVPGYRVAQSAAVPSPTAPSWRLELTLTKSARQRERNRPSVVYNPPSRRAP